jgi:hypothetical protein
MFSTSAAAALATAAEDAKAAAVVATAEVCRKSRRVTVVMRGSLGKRREAGMDIRLPDVEAVCN